VAVECDHEPSPLAAGGDGQGRVQTRPPSCAQPAAPGTGRVRWYKNEQPDHIQGPLRREFDSIRATNNRRLVRELDDHAASRGTQSCSTPRIGRRDAVVLATSVEGTPFQSTTVCLTEPDDAARGPAIRDSPTTAKSPGIPQTRQAGNASHVISCSIVRATRALRPSNAPRTISAPPDHAPAPERRGVRLAAVHFAARPASHELGDRNGQ